MDKRTSCERAACFCKRPGFAYAKAFGFEPLDAFSGFSAPNATNAHRLCVSSSPWSFGEVYWLGRP